MTNNSQFRNNVQKIGYRSKFFVEIFVYYYFLFLDNQIFLSCNNNISIQSFAFNFH